MNKKKIGKEKEIYLNKVRKKRWRSSTRGILFSGKGAVYSNWTWQRQNRLELSRARGLSTFHFYLPDVSNCEFSLIFDIFYNEHSFANFNLLIISYAPFEGH